MLSCSKPSLFPVSCLLTCYSSSPAQPPSYHSPEPPFLLWDPRGLGGPDGETHQLIKGQNLLYRYPNLLLPLPFPLVSPGAPQILGHLEFRGSQGDPEKKRKNKSSLRVSVSRQEGSTQAAQSEPTTRAHVCYVTLMAQLALSELQKSSSSGRDAKAI